MLRVIIGAICVVFLVAVGNLAADSPYDLLKGALGKHAYPLQAKAQAHHILGVAQFATPLGKKLHKWGIDLNSAQNGVWLPSHDYPGRVATLHRSRPSHHYTAEVNRRLSHATNREEALHILNGLKEDLQKGRLTINEAR